MPIEIFLAFSPTHPSIVKSNAIAELPAEGKFTGSTRPSLRNRTYDWAPSKLRDKSSEGTRELRISPISDASAGSKTLEEVEPGDSPSR
jgi:hypothetical protein